MHYRWSLISGQIILTNKITHCNYNITQHNNFHELVDHMKIQFLDSFSKMSGNAPLFDWLLQYQIVDLKGPPLCFWFLLLFEVFPLHLVFSLALRKRQTLPQYEPWVGWTHRQKRVLKVIIITIYFDLFLLRRPVARSASQYALVSRCA